ncbi:hypothetical protein [Phyllobacterium chamaecytisi]|uniref:hypothetical protein n=1 Tax=Phyllobacterium chamaecytisi TaxID=2876082 RepID=UPI001CCB9EBD|nr:hypothetical protein [Phyllobacterium sp. KW56]MBZ9603948.1 hypothetical protein [Phyllobacterium sp. KW56]
MPDDRTQRGQIYGTHPADYLDRAKERLQERTPESLFYAALELRFFLESRQDLYLNAQKAYARSVPRAWKTTHQWLELERIFGSDEIQHLHFEFHEGGQFDFYYTPVTLELRKGAEKLSEFLHAQAYHAASDVWWSNFLSKILDVYRRAWICSRGKLFYPALISKDGAIGKLALDARNGPEEYAPFFVPDAEITVKVDYLREPPSSWEYQEPVGGDFVGYLDSVT